MASNPPDRAMNRQTFSERFPGAVRQTPEERMKAGVLHDEQERLANQAYLKTPEGESHAARLGLSGNPGGTVTAEGGRAIDTGRM
jgi:sRNA-binding protein